jgi:PEP-CTERM motif
MVSFPPGFGNSGELTTVTIGPGTEFGFQDVANRDTSDFTGTTLTITDVSLAETNAFEMRFTDPAFLSFSLISNTLGITYSFSGNTLIINSPIQFFEDTRSAVFSYTSAPVNVPIPEPGTLELLGTGLLGSICMLRRKLHI